MTIEDERRGFSRVVVNIGATVVSGDERVQCEAARDLSMSGAYFVCSEALPVGSHCEVLFEFQAEERSIIIEVNGEVVRHGDDGFAVKFEDLQRMDSFDKIRNLVIYRALEEVSLPQRFE